MGAAPIAIVSGPPESPEAHLVPSLPRLWIGFVLTGVGLAAQLGELVLFLRRGGDLDSATQFEAFVAEDQPMFTLIWVVSVVYWLWCVHRTHKVLALVPAWKHPVSPGKAVGYHFIPFFNLYWIFAWTADIQEYDKWRSGTNSRAYLWASIITLVGFFSRFVDFSLATFLIFLALVPLKRRLKRTMLLAPRPPDAPLQVLEPTKELM